MTSLFYNIKRRFYIIDMRARDKSLTIRVNKKGTWNNWIFCRQYKYSRNYVANASEMWRDLLGWFPYSTECLIESVVSSKFQLHNVMFFLYLDIEL